jgi:hypothetical protein
MVAFKIVQSGRYGEAYPSSDAPSSVVVTGGTPELARHLAHIIQEWGWPGMEDMYEVENDDEDAPQSCGCQEWAKR